MKTMSSNPELQRYIWTKFSAFRLLAMPVVMSLIYANINWDVSWHTGALPISLILFGLIAGLWGNQNASNAFGEELGNKTWDFTRMSSLTPAQVMAGKLLGPNLYMWYFSIIPFAMIFFVTLGTQEEMARAFYMLFFLLSAAFAGHLMALAASSMMTSASDSRVNKTENILSFTAGCATSALVYFFSAPMQFLVNPAKGIDKAIDMHSSYASFFGLPLTQPEYRLLLVGFALFWLSVLAYRSIRTILLYKSTPAGWLSFCAASILLYIGLSSPREISDFEDLLLMISLALTGCAYAQIATEAGDIQRYRHLIARCTARQWRRAAEMTPLWIASFAATLAACLALVAVLFLAESQENKLATVWFPVLFLLFMLRDGIVFHLASLYKGARHTHFKIMLYLICSYLLVPFLVTGKLLPVRDMTTFKLALPWFYPTPFNNFFTTAGPVLVEIMILAFVARRLYLKRKLSI